MHFFVFDAITIVGGLFLIIAPEKAYNFGRRSGEKVEMPAGWPLKSRIIGAVFVVVGIVFVIIGL